MNTMNLDRFVHRVQSSTKNAASMAREAFQGLDAMAAQDEYIHSGDAHVNGTTTRNPSRGGGGESIAPNHDSRRPTHHPNATTRVRFSDRYDDHEERRDPAGSSSDRRPNGIQVGHASSSCTKRGMPQLQVGSSSDESARNPQSSSLRTSLSDELGNNDVDAGLRGSLYSHRESPTLTSAHNDKLDPDATPTANQKKKNRKRFLDDLDDRLSRPMKPMQIEQSLPGVSSSTVSSSSSSGGMQKWSSWLPASVTAWKSPPASNAASYSSSAATPAPLLARSRRVKASGSSSRNDDDPEHDVDQYQVKSSAAMLGDDELAHLKAMMDGTAGSDTTTSTGGDADAATMSRHNNSVDVWQRREAFVAVTLILFLLVYYLTRDVALVDDGT